MNGGAPIPILNLDGLCQPDYSPFDVFRVLARRFGPTGGGPSGGLGVGQVDKGPGGSHYPALQLLALLKSTQDSSRAVQRRMRVQDGRIRPRADR